LTPWQLLHIASGLCEHVKYLALSLLSHAPPRITTSRCSSSRETLVTSRSRPRRSSRQTQPCLLRSMPSAAVCRRATTRRSSNVPAVHPTTHQVCKAYLHFIPPTSRILQEGNAAFRPGANSFELHICASRCRPSLQPPEVYSLYRVMGALQPRACRVRPGLISAEQLGRGLRCRRDGWSLPHEDDSCAR
jgi:hypothetical protein